MNYKPPLDTHENTHMPLIVSAVNQKIHDALGIPQNKFVVKPIVEAKRGIAPQSIKSRPCYGFRVICSDTKYTDDIRRLLAPLEQQAAIRPYAGAKSDSAIAQDISLAQEVWSGVASDTTALTTALNNTLLSTEERLILPTVSRTV